MPPLLQGEDKPYAVVVSSIDANGDDFETSNVKSSTSSSSEESNRSASQHEEPQKQHRSVTFDDNLISRVIEPNQEHQPVDVDDNWYSRMDYERFKQECKTTLRLMIQKIREERASTAATTTTTPESAATDDEEYCTLGLENFIPSKLRIKNERRYILTEIVLECQELLRDDDDEEDVNRKSSNEDYLAWRSRHQTEKSRLEGQIRGEQLAVEVYRMNWNELNKNGCEVCSSWVPSGTNAKALTTTASCRQAAVQKVRSNVVLPVLKVVFKVAEALWSR